MFVESLAHLAMNMATIMSYAAENQHDPHLPGDPACRARVLALARQEAPEASCVNNRGTRGDHVVAPAGHDEMTLGVM